MSYKAYRREDLSSEQLSDLEYMIHKFREDHPTFRTFRTRMFGTEHCKVFIVGNRLRAIKMPSVPISSSSSLPSSSRERERS